MLRRAVIILPLARQASRDEAARGTSRKNHTVSEFLGRFEGFDAHARYGRSVLPLILRNNNIPMWRSISAEEALGRGGRALAPSSLRD